MYSHVTIYININQLGSKLSSLWSITYVHIQKYKYKHIAAINTTTIKHKPHKNHQHTKLKKQERTNSNKQKIIC